MNSNIKAVLLFDGDCDFCRSWVTRWKEIAGDAVQYRAYQNAVREFPQVSLHDCQNAVQLVMPDGKVYSAARAVFEMYAAANKRKWILWIYKYIPGFAWTSEYTYRYIAKRRRII
jgi:lipase maturation factor 1